VKQLENEIDNFTLLSLEPLMRRRGGVAGLEISKEFHYQRDPDAPSSSMKERV